MYRCIRIVHRVAIVVLVPPAEALIEAGLNDLRGGIVSNDQVSVDTLVEPELNRKPLVNALAKLKLRLQVDGNGVPLVRFLQCLVGENLVSPPRAECIGLWADPGCNAACEDEPATPPHAHLFWGPKPFGTGSPQASW